MLVFNAGGGSKKGPRQKRSFKTAYSKKRNLGKLMASENKKMTCRSFSPPKGKTVRSKGSRSRGLENLRRACKLYVTHRRRREFTEGHCHRNSPDVNTGRGVKRDGIVCYPQENFAKDRKEGEILYLSLTDKGVVKGELMGGKGESQEGSTKVGL